MSETQNTESVQNTENAQDTESVQNKIVEKESEDSEQESEQDSEQESGESEEREQESQQDLPKFEEIKVEDFPGKLDEIQKSFFVDEGKLTIYHDGNGVKRPVFSTSTKRLTCIEKFLTFYSQRIGELLLESCKNETIEGKTFIQLEYDGDEEVLESMIKNSENENRLDAKNIKLFIDKNEGNNKRSREDDMILDSVKKLENLSFNNEGYYPVLICVRKKGLKEFLYMNMIKINPLQLYTESTLPWHINISNNKEKDIKTWVNLSMFQKKYADEGKFVYYRTPDGMEPAIIGEDEKRKIINKIIQDSEQTGMFSSEDRKVISFDFRNGFRDFLSLYAGIKTKTTTIKFSDISTFSKEAFYDIIKGDFDKGATPLIFTVYIPKTENRVDVSYVPYKKIQ